MATFNECRFCEVKFIDEKKFQKHNCKPKQRYESLSTVEGKAAFYCYKLWRDETCYSSATPEMFLTSKYYSSFMKFVDFANRTRIPDKKEYIKFMTSMKVLPHLWMNTDMYLSFIEYFDEKPPMEKVEVTIDTILKVSEMLECEPGQIFEHLLPGEITDLIKTRKLSPWVLLFSKKFQEFLIYKTTKEQKLQIQALISTDIWKKLIENNKPVVNKVKLYVSELGL